MGLFAVTESAQRDALLSETHKEIVCFEIL